MMIPPFAKIIQFGQNGLKRLARTPLSVRRSLQDRVRTSSLDTITEIDPTSLSPAESEMTEGPLTSVVIPARNAEKTIERTLQSLVAQTYSSWEALIVDDGSVDATSSVVARYASRDARFIALKSSGNGVAAARNVGISHASGERLLFLDSDDWIDPHCLGKLNAALNESPSAIAAYCNYSRVMPDGNESFVYGDSKLEKDPFETFARICAAVVHGVLVKRSAVLKVGNFDTTLRTCEDWDLWQRIARGGERWTHVNEKLSYYHASDNSLSRDVRQMESDAHTVIARGFSSDERVRDPAPIHRNGASTALGSAAEAYAFFVLWCAGIDCAQRNACEVSSGFLADIPRIEASTDKIASYLLDSTMVGLRVPPARLAECWDRYGKGITYLIRAVGQAWNDPRAARRIQYRFERMVLHYDHLSAPRPLTHTLGMRIDLRRLPSIRPARNIDRLYIHLCDGRHTLASMDIGVLGDIDFPFWMTIITRHLRHLDIGESAPRLVRLKMKIYSRSRRLHWFLWRSNHSHQSRLQAIERAMSYRVRPLSSLGEEASDSSRRRGQEPSRDLDRKAFWDVLFQEEDPWNYGSAYEQEKYARQLQMLPVERPKRALELACAEGHFTCQLAPRVGYLVAADISIQALKRARARCGEHRNVDFAQLDLTAEALPQDMDLIVCSEVLYYLNDEAELESVAKRLFSALRPGGHLVTAHAFVLKDNMSRTGFDWDNPYGAQTIARVVGSVPDLALEASMQAELYRVDRYRRLFSEEIAPDPQITVVGINAPIETEVARLIVWNGAAARRSEVAQTERRDGVPVLMYHRIATDGPSGLEPYRLSPTAFQEQMLWLRRNGYHTINSEQLAWFIANNHPFVGRPVLITFDDGYQDFAEQAWPILQRNDFSAEVFVVTDLVGKHAEWDVSFGPPAPLMEAATIVSLAAEGVTFGSHLASHPRSDGPSTSELAEELLRSRIQLEKWLGRSVTSLAAPFGCTDQRLRILAAECGYTIGFNTINRVATLKDDLLDLPRIEVRGDCTIEMFAASLEACR